MRTVCWLLLAVVAGSTIGFKVALPSSDSGPVPSASATPYATQAPLAFAPPSGRPVTPVGLDTGGPSSPGLRHISRAGGETVATYGPQSGGGSAPDATFDSPYASDLRFLALPGVVTTPPASSSPSDTTTAATTPAAPTGPPPEIEDVHTLSLTPFSATIAWRTNVPATSRIAYGLDAPVLWTAPSVASTQHQARFRSASPSSPSPSSRGGGSSIDPCRLGAPPR